MWPRTPWCIFFVTQWLGPRHSCDRWRLDYVGWNWFPVCFPWHAASLREVMSLCRQLCGEGCGYGSVMVEPGVFLLVFAHNIGTYVHAFRRSDYKNCEVFLEGNITNCKCFCHGKIWKWQCHLLFKPQNCFKFCSTKVEMLVNFSSPLMWTLPVLYVWLCAFTVKWAIGYGICLTIYREIV